MIGFLIRWLINFAALLVVVHTVKGIEVQSLQIVLVAALVLGIINAVLRPIIIFITLPINILTLGIFTFFINGFMFYLVSKIIKGFQVADFWSAFWGALVFSVISFLLSLLVNQKGRLGVRIYEYNYRNRNSSPGQTVIDIKTDEKL